MGPNARGNSGDEPRSSALERGETTEQEGYDVGKYGRCALVVKETMAQTPTPRPLSILTCHFLLHMTLHSLLPHQPRRGGKARTLVHPCSDTRSSPRLPNGGAPQYAQSPSNRCRYGRSPEKYL